MSWEHHGTLPLDSTEMLVNLILPLFDTTLERPFNFVDTGIDRHTEDEQETNKCYDPGGFHAKKPRPEGRGMLRCGGYSTSLFDPPEGLESIGILTIQVNNSEVL